MLRPALLLIAAFIAASLPVATSHAFKGIEMEDADSCIRCHELGFEEATEMVKAVNPEVEVMEIKDSPVSGLWEIIVMARGKRGVAYIDYTKSYIITGSIIDVDTRVNLTNSRLYEISKIDVAEIPLDEALLMGNPDARFKAIVFDDPDCAYCKKLHREMQTIIAENDEIAFYIKLLPLKIHPTAYKKSKSIVCRKSLALLERSYDGRPLPEPSCETTEVDDNIELAERLGINTTPTIILPDGGVVVGFKDREALTDMIETSGRAVEEIVATRETEIEAERLRKLRSMEKKDYKSATKADTAAAFYTFLDRYPEGAKRKEALFHLADIIDRSNNRDPGFRDLVSRYPDAIKAIPESDRLLYVGPGELPVYIIIEFLKEGEPEARLARRISSIEGKYKEFTVEEARQLAEMGISDTIINAMLEATFKARTRERKALREQEIQDLLEQIDRAQATIYDMEATFESRQSLDPDMPPEAITDEVGNPLKEKIKNCKEMLKEFASCKRAKDVSRCVEAARADSLCQ